MGKPLDPLRSCPRDTEGHPLRVRIRRLIRPCHARGGACMRGLRAPSNSPALPLAWTMDNGHRGEGRSTSPLCPSPNLPHSKNTARAKRGGRGCAPNPFNMKAYRI